MALACKKHLKAQELKKKTLSQSEGGAGLPLYLPFFVFYDTEWRDDIPGTCLSAGLRNGGADRVDVGDVRSNRVGAGGRSGGWVGKVLA